ncbi:MAG: hypothetical protein HY074_12180 [Deltaproteobacteria bacterium]|nr:hypothetical protein [Deltaproteobacteria bacterium]
MKSLKITTFVLSLVFGALHLCGCQSLEDRAGEALIGQFKGACVSKGHWTDAALAQNRALQGTLEELKKLDPCKGFDAQLATIQGLSADIDGALSDPGFKNNLQNMSSLTDQVLTLFKYPQASAVSAAELGKNIFRGMLNIGKQQSDHNSNLNELQIASLKRNSNEFIKKTQAMMADINGLQQCLLQSPRASIQLASQLMTLAGGASSPATGASISVASQLLSGVLASLSDSARIDRTLYQFQKNDLPEGLTCAMESMTELYCQAEDVRELLEFQASSYQQRRGADFPVEPIWRGMDILTRRLPVIADMLRRVRYGNEPSDKYDSDRKSSTLTKAIMLENLRLKIQGQINMDENIYNRLGTTSGNAGQGDLVMQRQAIMIGLLNHLSGSLGGGFGEEQSEFKMPSDPKRVACMLAFDPDPNKCPGLDTAIDSTQRLEQYIRKYFIDGQFPTNFQKIRANWKIVYNRINDMVNAELAQQITIDPKLTVVSIMEPAGIDNISPYDALVRVVEFADDLEKMLNSDARVNYDPLLPQILDDTKKRINNVLDLVKNKADLSPGGSPELDDQAIIKKIYDVFQLRIGTQFITDRIKQLVEWDLNRRLKRGELPENTAAILAAAGGLMTDQMAGNTTGLDQIKLDIDHAQALTQANIKTFLEYFRGGSNTDAFEDATQALFQQAQDAKEPQHGPRRPNRNSLAELCILALTSFAGDHPWELTMDVPFVGTGSKGPAGYLDACRGAFLESAYSYKDQAVLNPNDAPSVGGFPMSLSYSELYDFFSTGRTGTSETVQKITHWEEDHIDSKLRTIPYVGSWLAPPPVGTQNPGLYAELFHNTVVGAKSVGEQAYYRKVCTFHRFLRAGRIMESFPALGLKTP